MNEPSAVPPSFLRAVAIAVEGLLLLFPKGKPKANVRRAMDVFHYFPKYTYAWDERSIAKMEAFKNDFPWTLVLIPANYREDGGRDKELFVYSTEKDLWFWDFWTEEKGHVASQKDVERRIARFFIRPFSVERVTDRALCIAEGLCQGQRP